MNQKLVIVDLAIVNLFGLLGLRETVCIHI